MAVTDVVIAGINCREGLFLKVVPAATFVCLIVLILGRLHSYHLDENERIAKRLRRSDR
jgi:hypothetical protein